MYPFLCVQNPHPNPQPKLRAWGRFRFRLLEHRGIELLFEIPIIVGKELFDSGDGRNLKLSLYRQRIDGALDFTENLGSLGGTLPTEHTDELHFPFLCIEFTTASICFSTGDVLSCFACHKRQHVGSLGEDVDLLILCHRCHFLSVLV